MSSLLVAHQEPFHLALLDTNTLETQTQFQTPGRIVVLGASSDKRYGFAVLRDDGCVSIIDGANGKLVQVAQTESQPTHFHAHDDSVVIFNDGDGSVSVFDTNAIDASPRTVKATQPDHGSAVIIDGLLFAGHFRLGKIDVYRVDDGSLVESFSRCLQLHGAAQKGNNALFGCNDSVMIIRKEGDTLTQIKVTNPGEEPRQNRVGLFAEHPANPLLLGNFGEGIALIDPEAAQMRVAPLPAHPADFDFDFDGKTALALTTDGWLRRIDLATGEQVTQVEVMAEVEVRRGPSTHARSGFTVGSEGIYLLVAEENRLAVLDSETFAVKAERTLDHPATAVTWLT